MSDLVSQARALGAKVGLYMQPGYDGDAWTMPVTCYSNIVQDAALFASWGIDYLKLDRTLNNDADEEEWMAQFTSALDSACMSNGIPRIYISAACGNVAESYVVAHPWMPLLCNSMRLCGDADGTSPHFGYWQNVWYPAVASVSWLTGPGHFVYMNGQASVGYTGGGASMWFTTNDTRAWYGMSAMTYQELCNSGLPSDPTDLATVFNNPEFVELMRDSLFAPGWPVSTNGTSQTWIRPLYNGDWLVSLWNQGTTSTASISLALTNLVGFPTNVASVRDIFGRSSVLMTNAVSATVNTNGCNLYRISVPAQFNGSAAAIAVVVNGFVVGATITDGGYGYTNTPTVRILGGGGSGAEAVAVVSNWVVVAVNVLDAGSGYTNAPVVVIDPPFIPNPVLGIAPMSFLAFSNLTRGGVYQLQQSVGWYWSNQPVSITATNALYTQMVAGVVSSGDYRLALNPVPAQAFATAAVDYGSIVHATVTSGGSGYVISPEVTIVGGGGTNATAVANISGGVVTSITITDAGVGYTNTPTIRIAPPPAVAVSPTVSPVMRLDSARLSPYDNYQIQFKPTFGGAWENWNGGLFNPTALTNSQYLFITNGAGFFRLEYVP